jgi:hypothetical protein
VANDIVVDETLPNFIKRRHPRKGEIKGQGSTFMANIPKEAGHIEVNGTTK